MKINILAYENCTASMVVGMTDILSLANLQHGKRLFDVSIVTMTGKPVTTFNGLTIAPTGSAKTKVDFIYIPGFLADPIQVIEREQRSIKWLTSRHHGGTTVLAACNGNILLAESGILNGRSATTHWTLKDMFTQRYPNVNLKLEKIIVDEGDFISAAGVTAYANLALHVVAKFGSPDLASYCSKIFLIDAGRRSQTPYLTFTAPKSHGDTEVVRVQEWIEGNFRKPVTIDSVMNVSAMGRRTLLRRFKKATGETPLEYLQQIRIESAKRSLETTNKTFAEITWDVGYNDISSFQRLFKTTTRLTPKEYRNKFTLVA